MTTTFPERYAAAQHALRTAQQQTKPLPADLIARLREWNLARYEEAEAAGDVIRTTIPALQAEVDKLAELACGRCFGTGYYQAPTGRLINGKPLCFNCKGSGRA